MSTTILFGSKFMACAGAEDIISIPSISILMSSLKSLLVRNHQDYPDCWIWYEVGSLHNHQNFMISPAAEEGILWVSRTGSINELWQLKSPVISWTDWNSIARGCRVEVDLGSWISDVLLILYQSERGLAGVQKRMFGYRSSRQKTWHRIS
jgi:hypothetical protein